MAKQRGFMKLSGELDGCIFYKTKYGDLVRTKGNVATERRKVGPEFENSRLSNEEFKYASRVGKLIRKGMQHAPMVIEPGDTNTRLVQIIRKVQELDCTHERGERVVTEDNAWGLRGFEWNPDSPVLVTLMARHELNIDTDNSRVSFKIKGFDAGEMVRCTSAVTHVDLILSVAAVDYEADSQVGSFDGAGALSVVNSRPADVTLECDIPRNAGNLIVVGLGIQMYKEVNGWMNKLRTGSGFVVLGAVM